MSDLLQQFFSSQTFGVIIGAVLTAGFTWFIEFLRAQREEKQHLKRKREEVYLRMLKILYLIRNEGLNCQNKSISKEREKEMEECYAPINLYASRKIKDIYNFTAKSIDVFFMQSSQDTKPLETAKNTIDTFIDLIRKEVGIED